MRFQRFHERRLLTGCWEGRELDDDPVHRPLRVAQADLTGECLHYRMRRDPSAEASGELAEGGTVGETAEDWPA